MFATHRSSRSMSRAAGAKTLGQEEGCVTKPHHAEKFYVGLVEYDTPRQGIWRKENIFSRSILEPPVFGRVVSGTSRIQCTVRALVLEVQPGWFCSVLRVDALLHLWANPGTE